MKKNRVVITGLGVVSSIGIGKDEFWKNLTAGKSGIGEIATFHTPTYGSYKGGEIKKFKPKTYTSGNLGRASRFAIDVAKESLDDAKLNFTDIQKNRMGIVFGTTNGEAQYLEEMDRIWVDKGESEVWAATIAKYPVDSIAENVARFFKINGLSCMIPTACAAGNYSIGRIYDLISSNKIDIGIAGGADPLTRYAFAGFGRLFAMAPEKCQPFDKNRKGMMIGEGAGALLVEEMEHALERNANIYAEILGYGLSCDAYHMTAPRVEGIVKAIERAIKNSNIKKENVDYICAHGTGTPVNDKVECEAINKVFKERTKNIFTSSIKSMLGHTMGAASAIEAVACCLAIKNGVIPPTINFETQDSNCEINCVPNIKKVKKIEIALNNSFAFGGNNACVAFGRIKNDK